MSFLNFAIELSQVKQNKHSLMTESLYDQGFQLTLLFNAFV